MVISFVMCLGISGANGPADFVARVGSSRPGKKTAMHLAAPLVAGVPNLPRSSSFISTEIELLRHPPIIEANSVTIAVESLVRPAPPRMVTMEVTAYCACKKCCGSHAKGLTASGRPVTFNGGRFVAADTRLFPYGTKLIVPGYNDEKPVEVIDRGGAIKGYHIDIFMPTHLQAVAWGKRRLTVTIVQERGKDE